MLCLLGDTCVWLDLAKNVNGGQLIAACRQLIDEERLELLVPQIVIDEFERNRDRIEADIARSVSATFHRVRAAFGARVFTIDGHDVAEIDRAMAHASDITGDQPTVILARTIKGRGFSEVEDREGWHGKPFSPEMAERAIIELGGERDLIVRGPKPDQAAAARALAVLIMSPIIVLVLLGRGVCGWCTGFLAVRRLGSDALRTARLS